MILGLGNDLTEIARVEKTAQEECFLARTFTEEERRQSGGGMIFLVGCFIVEEAAVRCFGTGFWRIEPMEIEALRDALRRPYVRFLGTAMAYCATLDGLTPLVSVSNIETRAMAAAVFERGDRGGTKWERKQTTCWC